MRDLLKKVALFKGLNKRVMDSIATNAEVIEYSADATIIEEGSKGTEIYVVLSGTVKVLVNIEEPEEPLKIEVFEMKRGDFFGEFSFFTNRPRSATVKAGTDAQIITITKKQIEDIVESDCCEGMKFYKNISKLLTTRIISSDKKVKKWFKNII